MMYRVDIYLETDSWYLGVRQRKAGYYIRCTLNNGQDYEDIKALEVKGTYNHCLLTAMSAALSRMKKASEIHIHSINSYILDMLDKQLPLWAESDFRNKKGEVVKDHELWREIWELSRPHIVVTEQGLHEFSNWMRWMFTRLEDKTVDNPVEKPEEPHKQ